jgi:hypothetical protein
MERPGQQLGDDVMERLSHIGHHLLRLPMSAEGSGEEPAGRGKVASSGEVDVDDWAVLMRGPVDVPPGPATFTEVSSTNQRPPTGCRPGRAAASRGVKRCTQRHRVT